MGTRKILRKHLELHGLTVGWLTASGHARISGTPNDPYFEPFPSNLRADVRNRIPIYGAIGRARLVFLRALLHDVRPIRVTAESFVRAPFASTFLLIGIVIAKLTGRFAEIQAKSEIAISIAEHNRLPTEEFPFDTPLTLRGISFTPGAFYVEEPSGRTWQLDTTVLSNVNLIEVEPPEEETTNRPGQEHIAA